MFFGGFLFNLLCSLVPTCNQQYSYPVISTSQNGYDFGNRFNQQSSPSISSNITNSLGSEFDHELKQVDPVVNTTTGSLEGYMMKTIAGSSIYAFEGVPYSEPPIGFRRFRAPVPKVPWSGLRQAKKSGPDCLQLSVPRLFQVVGDEDCLFLNIFSPVLTFGGINPSLPVIIFFHGGSYHQGSGSHYGPTYLLDQDVILVTVNYRLGVLGFMSTNDNYNSGNWGLKDQQLSLKWLHENLKSFGGDPERVTLMGHGTGGAMAHLHLMSSKSQDYFQSVVSLSGTALSHWSVNSPEMSRRWTMKLANIIGCPTASSALFMECIYRQSSFHLVAATIQLYEWFYFPSITFAPVVEPKGLDAFLTETPEQAYERGHVAKKPFMATRIVNEGHSTIFLLKRYNRLAELRFNWERLAPHYLAFDYGVSNSTEITNTLTKVYFGMPPAQATLDPLSDITGDRKVSHGLHKSLQAHYKLAPTYAYVFTYKGMHNLASANGLGNDEWGSGHMEDVYMYFNSSSYVHGMSQNDSDYKVSKFMTSQILANWALRPGDPLISDEAGGFIKIWEPVTTDVNIKFLQIDGSVKMIPDAFVYQNRFWEAMGLSDTTPLRTT